MTTERLINNGTTTVNSFYTAGATTLVVADATKLPSLSGSDQYRIVVFNPLTPTNAEIMTVTARSSNTLTVTPASEAINGAQVSQNHAVGETVANELTVGSLTAFVNGLLAAFTGSTNLTTVGTIGTGLWRSSNPVEAAYGGTGLNSSGSDGLAYVSGGTWNFYSTTDGGVLFGGPGGGGSVNANTDLFWNSLYRYLGLGTSGTPAAGLHLAGPLQGASFGANGLGLRIDSATYTDTTASGTVSQMAAHQIGTPTFAASFPITVTTGSTLRLAAGPTAGSNVTITNPLALQIASGNTQLNGNVYIGSTITAGPKLYVLLSSSGATPASTRGAQLAVDVAETVASTSSEVTAVYGNVRVLGTNTQALTNLQGVTALYGGVQVLTSSAGTISAIHCLYLQPPTHGGTQTINSCYGGRVNAATNTGSGTISNLAGLALTNQTVGTNNANLLCGTVSNPTGTFGAYFTTVAGTKAVVIRGAASRTASLLQLQTSGAASLGNVGGCIFDHNTDGSSTNTNGTEDTLYTDTIAANTLLVVGDKVRAIYAISLVLHATATRRVRVYFAGTVILDTGAITSTSGVVAEVAVSIEMDSSSSVRTICRWSPSAGTVVVSNTAVTGLTLTATNILKITGVAAATGAASGDIKATMAYGEWVPSAS